MRKVGKRKIILNMLLVSFLLLAAVCASLVSFRTAMRKREYKNQLNALRELSLLGSYMVQEKLQGYLNVLNGMAELLPPGELHTEENLERLKTAASRQELDFVRIGLANQEGKSILTNGSEFDISDSSHFAAAMENREVITENRESVITEEGIFIAAVPVPDEQGKPRGVLYGIIRVEDFHIYEHTSLDYESQYIQVTDRNGNYIFREFTKNPIVRDDNIYEGLRQVEGDIPTETIIEKIGKGEEIITRVSNGDGSYIICFMPIPMNDWYVVTVMAENDIFSGVQALLGNDLYILIAEIIGVSLIACGLVVYFLRKEGAYIKTLYERLKMNDEMIRAAVSGSHTLILVYDMAENQLRILSNENLKINLPPVVDDASVKLAEYVSNDEESREKIRQIFERLKETKKSEDFMFSIPVEDGLHFYRMHVKKLYGEYSRSVQCVGVVEDMTEEMKLKDEVTMREHLLSGIAGFMVVDLNEDRVLKASEVLGKFYRGKESYSEIVRTKGIANIPKEYQKQILTQMTAEKLLEAFEQGRYQVEIEYPVSTGEGNFWLESHVRLDQDRESGHIIAYHLLRNISDKKQKELILAEQADRDYLTGLYNRRSGTTLINEFLKVEESEKERNHAFVLLDLDNFKKLNDTLGHQRGDAALQDMAAILRRHFREYDILCRLAGDEFIVFLKDIPMDVIQKNMESLMKKLILTYEDGEISVTVTASAGIALSPMHGNTFSSLYVKADKALYHVKENGKQSFEVYGE